MSHSCWHRGDGLFEQLYRRLRNNWLRYREPDRWPTPKNWVLRVAPQYTSDPNSRVEKQLQKQIAISLETDGWGNDMPTASGLVNSGSRQMNIDLARQHSDGFDFVELKISSDTPYDAAIQILRYGAIYLLYRLEPELALRFRQHAVMCARRIALIVLAPQIYYAGTEVDLSSLQRQLDCQVGSFASARVDELELSFRFLALPPDFTYRPGMDEQLIRDAVSRISSPFFR